MKVVIFSGGTGSAALQSSFNNKFGQDIDLSIIINMYDNGKSTGAVRQVFNGNILGPSDLRKNQTRQYSFKDNYSKSIYDVLEHRFTSDNPKQYVLDKVDEIPNNEIRHWLIELVSRYFDNSKSKEITYSDFSIGNIVYAQLAADNNNSMQIASDIVKEKLDINNSIIINDDTSYFLKAVTKSGRVISDEAEIVEYFNAEDRIVDIKFTDFLGVDHDYCLLNDRSVKEIQSADIIIFSSGTQWSSLIPTYKSKTVDGISFKEVIKNCNAKKYLVMNSKEDADMIGLSADEILDILEAYIPVDDLAIAIAEDADKGLDTTTRNSIRVNLDSNKKHSDDISAIIISDYFGNPDGVNDTFIFDWDDTLVARKGLFSYISKQNLVMLKQLEHNSFVVSGNSHFNIKHSKVYADAALNYYEDGKFIKCVDHSYIIGNTLDTVKLVLSRLGINQSMFIDRGNVCLGIKPINPDYRNIVHAYIKTILPEGFTAKLTGNTTIDIYKTGASKLLAVKDITSNKDNKIFYLGDEWEVGNDSEVYVNREDLKLNFVKIKSVKDTNIFLRLAAKWI